MSVRTNNHSRRKQGRHGNRYIRPADTTVKIRKDVLDKIDLFVDIPRMPLGAKIESLLRMCMTYRKNSVGSNQPLNENLPIQTQLVNTTYFEDTNEPIEQMDDDKFKKLWKELDQ